MAKTKSKATKKVARKTSATSKKRAPAKKKAAAAASKKSAKNGTTKKKGSAAATKKSSRNGTGTVKGDLPYPMKLRGNIFLRFKAAAAEMGELLARVEATKAKVDLLLSRPIHFEVTRALQDRDQVIKDARVKRDEVAQIQLECGKKLGIKPEDLQNYSFDSATGVVLPITPP